MVYNPKEEMLIRARIPVGGLDGEWHAAPMAEQPRPVILDPLCRAHLPKLLNLVSLNQAKSPWVFCRDDINEGNDRYIPLELENERFPWTNILATLSARKIKSVMIEGGASVINDVLTQKMADIIVITIAPVFLGKDGVGINASLEKEWLHDVHSLSIGRDMVIAGRIQS
jgi:2,5-diamino-6-(ribosylamino)-4(3H)-pyrimidinone 5'-phosphate reductase